MMLAALVLVFLSISAWFSNLVKEMRNNTIQAINFSSRLQDLSNKQFDDARLKRLEREVNEQISLFPTAHSKSVAEAQALTELENILGSLISRKRFNLLGSEGLNTETTSFWSVRLEVNGQLQSTKLIDLLTHFDSTQVHRRLNAFRYQVNRSNTINLVVDLLYLGTQGE